MFDLKKRIFLVNRDLQLRYAKSAAVAGIVSSILTGIVILYPLYVFQILRIPKFLPAPILFSMALAIVLNVFVIAGFSIFMTHKIAGPIYGLLREFRRVAAGYFGHEMRVRKDDELKYMIRNFNEVSLALKEITEVDLKALNTIMSSIEQGDSVAAKDDLMALKSRVASRINWTKQESNDD